MPDSNDPQNLKALNDSMDDFLDKMKHLKFGFADAGANAQKLTDLIKEQNDKTITSQQELWEKATDAGREAFNTHYEKAILKPQEELLKKQGLHIGTAGEKLGLLFGERVATGAAGHLQAFSSKTGVGVESLTAAFPILEKVATSLAKVTEGIAVFSLIAEAIDVFVKEAGAVVALQMNLGSSGGAYTASLADLAPILSSNAMNAAKFYLSTSDLDKSLNKIVSSSITGTLEIGQLAHTMDINSSSFSTARATLLLQTADALAEVASIGPAFGKSTEEMSDMMLKLHGTFNVAIPDMKNSLLSLLVTSAQLGISTSELWAYLDKVGDRYRYSNTGLATLNTQLGTFGMFVWDMHSKLSSASLSSQNFSKLITDMSESFSQMPVEQIAALTQMANPGMSTVDALNKSFSSSPLTNMVLESKMLSQNMSMSTQDQATFLAASLPGIKGHGAESLEMSKILVSLASQSSRIASMSLEEQKSYFHTVGGTMGDKIVSESIKARVTSEGLLKTISDELGTLITIGMRILNSALIRMGTKLDTGNLAQGGSSTSPSVNTPWK